VFAPQRIAVPMRVQHVGLLLGCARCHVFARCCTGRSKGWGIVEYETPEEVHPSKTSQNLAIGLNTACAATLPAALCLAQDGILSTTHACCPAHPDLIPSMPCLSMQAVRAVETLNGTDLGGRKILVREDREDKDVKNYNRCACLSPGLHAHPHTTLQFCDNCNVLRKTVLRCKQVNQIVT